MIGKVDLLLLSELTEEVENSVLEVWHHEESVRQILFCPHPEQSVASLKQVIADLQSPYVLIVDCGAQLQPNYRMLERMRRVLNTTGASMVYADYLEEKDGELKQNKLSDYQQGSVRNDFNFGPAIMTTLEMLKEWTEWEQNNYQFAGLYSFRLFASRQGQIVHIPEILSSKTEKDTRLSGEKQFDYVRKEAEQLQKEMELACTEHLKAINAYLNTPSKTLDFSVKFPVEATVVIPVKNRANTIKEAVKSVLSQKCDFRFNLLVVDNHSNDGTSEIIDELGSDMRLIHVKPTRTDLGIGGCWSEALHHSACGKFLVQLDSDDLYKDENTLQSIVDKFYEAKCAMVIGSYEMVDFDLKPIPPFLVDHREWTDENGANNALRINGLGAPRAFFTPVLKEIGIPNVSYGEDYALGLAISGEYRIGRIYEPLYLCRRWTGNSDAALDNASVNAHNHYKDALRSVEIMARQKRNRVD